MISSKLFFIGVLFVIIIIIHVNDVRAEEPKLSPFRYFDFDIIVDSEPIRILQGNTATINVVIKTKTDTPEKIRLDAIKYSDVDINLWFSIPIGTPTYSTSFFIETSCTTATGHYFFSIDGKSENVWQSSAEMINILVIPNPNCNFPPQDKNDNIALKNKASVLYKKGDKDKALSYYDKVLDSYSDDIVALRNKAIIMYEKKQFHESIKIADKILQVEPNEPWALKTKADSLYDLSKYEESMFYYDKILEIKPSDVTFLKSKADALYDIKRFGQAMIFYDKILEIESDNWIVLTNKANALYELGKYHDAIKIFDQVIQTESNNWIVLTNKANALYELGKYHDAITYYDKALKINPDVQQAITYKRLATEKSNQGGGCLIATAMYDSELTPQIQQLRELRDNKLLQTESGTSFINTFNDFYYSFSPTIADWERENPAFKEFVKISLTPMISSLSILNYVDMDSEAKVLGYGISLIMLNVGMYFVAPVGVIMVIRKQF